MMLDPHPQKQLFKTLPNLKLFDYFVSGTLAIKDGSKTPFIVWPDRTPCHLANLYMLHLLERPGVGGRDGLSREGSRGGSLSDYAAKISQLLRYCYNSRTDLIQLTDQMFSDFINKLRRETSRRHPDTLKKSEPTLLATGRVCLDFLMFVGKLYGDTNFVSPDGAIRISYTIHKNLLDDKRYSKRVYLSHHSLSNTGRQRERFPISDDAILRLRNAIDTSSGSRHLKQRRHLILSLLEYTGARISEIASLTIQDVLAAQRMKEPMLHLKTMKQGEGRSRLIPINRMLTADLNKYLKIYRSQIVGKSRKYKNHNTFFVSDATGAPLGAGSITKELGRLRTAAEIEEEACPHMFRHRFITNLFALLIKQHELNTKDDFRRALLDSQQFMAEVMLWTGHKSIAGVTRYIKLAFSQLAGYASTVSSVRMVTALNYFDQQQTILLRCLSDGMTVSQYTQELENLKALRDEEIRDGLK
jgi:integrase